MRGKEYIKERQKRKRARRAGKATLREASLNSYQPGNPDYDLKQGVVDRIAHVEIIPELDIPLNELARLISVDPRISNRQKLTYVSGLSQAGILVPSGYAGRSDSIRFNINKDQALQTGSLVNLYIARNSSDKLEVMDLLVSVFNNAHIAAGRINLYIERLDHRSRGARRIRTHFAQVMNTRQNSISELTNSGVIKTEWTEALMDAQREDQFLQTPGADYLVVLPFRDPIIKAANLAEALKHGQDLIYLGFALGVKQVAPAEILSSNLSIEFYKRRKLLSSPNP